MVELLKVDLYTIILDYKKNTYIYQLFANNEKDAQIKWAQQIDLNKIGICNSETIKNHLITDTMDEDYYPYIVEEPDLGKLQSVWGASACTSFGEGEENLAFANIVATASIKEHTQCFNDKNIFTKKQILFQNLKTNKNLYTIQLDYKGGSYVYQIFASDPVEAKITWIQQLDFHVISGAPNKNIEEIRNNNLLQQTEPHFVPQALQDQDFDSVWSTSVQLGDEIGRITIVATKPDNFQV